MSYRYVLGACKAWGLFPYSFNPIDSKEPLSNSKLGLGVSAAIVTLICLKFLSRGSSQIYAGDQGILTLVFYTYTLALSIPVYKTLTKGKENLQYFNDFFKVTGDAGISTFKGLNGLMCWQAIVVLVKITVIIIKSIQDNDLAELLGGISDTWIYMITFADTLGVTFILTALNSTYDRLIDSFQFTMSQPGTSAESIKNLRARHLELYEFCQRTNTTFGLRNFTTIMMTVFSFLQFVYSIIGILSKDSYSTFGELAFIFSVVVNCELMVSLVYLAYVSTLLTEKGVPMITNVLANDLNSLNPNIIQEVVLFVEDLSVRVVELTASGCYKIGVPLLYSIAGAVFSFILIIGPPMMSKSTQTTNATVAPRTQ